MFTNLRKPKALPLLIYMVVWGKICSSSKNEDTYIVAVKWCDSAWFVEAERAPAGDTLRVMCLIYARLELCASYMHASSFSPHICTPRVVRLIYTYTYICRSSLILHFLFCFCFSVSFSFSFSFPLAFVSVRGRSIFFFFIPKSRRSRALSPLVSI